LLNNDLLMVVHLTKSLLISTVLLFLDKMHLFFYLFNIQTSFYWTHVLNHLFVTTHKQTRISTKGIGPPNFSYHQLRLTSLCMDVFWMHMWNLLNLILHIPIEFKWLLLNFNWIV
jgi:hypothetical protein